MSLSFLKNITLASNSAVKTPVARTKAAASRNPEKADIRIYKDGSVYPSAKLVEQCNLQYTAKDAEDKGNGFDVFSSGDFLNTKHLAEKFLFIALVSKAAGKVDLFSQTTYEENGAAKSDVLTQGANTTGKFLLEKIKEVYGIELKEGQSYMDLKIVSDSPFTTDDNIYYVPKTVSRGEKKGEISMVRREDLTLYALVPVQMLGEEEAPVSETAPAADTEQGSDLDIDNGEGTSIEENPIQEDDLGPSLDEIEAETEETPAPAAELPEGVLNTDEDDTNFFIPDGDPSDDDDTLSV